MSDSLDKLNNELPFFIGETFEDKKIRQLKVEDVKEQKLCDAPESNNVISIEKMYENNEVKIEINKLQKVKDNVLTPSKLKTIL